MDFNRYFLGYTSLQSVDRIVLGRRRTGQPFSNFQLEELLKSFLNNSKLTEDVKVELSNRLGLTRLCISDFFRRRNKKPRNQTIEEYSKLLQGEKLKYFVIFVFALHLLSLLVYVLEKFRVSIYPTIYMYVSVS